MNVRARREEVRALRATRTQVAALLSRYPKVSDEDTKLILGFLRTGRHLDVGMLTAEESLKPQLDRFMADHARHFRVGVFEASAVIAAIAGFLIVCWLAWEAVKPAALTA
jgi:hypothetical protein